MRWLLLLIILVLAYFYFLPERVPKPIEETFIGEQIKPLRKAEGFEDEYLKSVKEQQKKMEEQLERESGG